MSPRKGVSHSSVVEAGCVIVDQVGAGSLSVAAVAAQLGVKPPSLYNHIESLDSLRRDIALLAVIDLGDTLRDAVMGRSGVEALRVAGKAFRAYASTHPGLYALSAQARPDDVEFAAASLRAVEPILAVLRSYGLDQDQSVHAARTLRSALHGFVSLENIDGFGLEVDVDASFDWMLGVLSASLDRTPYSA